MKIKRPRLAAMLLTVIVLALCAVSRLRADAGSCNGINLTLPFTDVAGNPFFCQIAEAYFSGLTTGTSATTYSPSANVPREQMAAFVTRTLDQSLRRGSQRAALKQFWTPKNSFSVALTSVGNETTAVVCDGADL